MSSNLFNADKIIEKSDDLNDYISFKIKPIGLSCCCLNHSSFAWNDINEFINPFGSLGSKGKNEDFVIIERDGEKYILECHESGPEIILYIGASIGAIKAIIELITVIIKAFNKEDKHLNKASSFKITSRRIKGEKIIEEDIIEVQAPLSKEMVRVLEEHIKNNKHLKEEHKKR